MIDISPYLVRQYSAQPCWELVADFYTTEFDEIPVAYKTVRRTVREMASEFRIAIHKSPHGFVQVADPVENCIVLLAKSASVGIHHCGVYVNGKVLHAQPEMTLHEELSTLHDRFEVVEFWARP